MSKKLAQLFTGGVGCWKNQNKNAFSVLFLAIRNCALLLLRFFWPTEAAIVLVAAAATTITKPPSVLLFCSVLCCFAIVFVSSETRSTISLSSGRAHYTYLLFSWWCWLGWWWWLGRFVVRATFLPVLLLHYFGSGTSNVDETLSVTITHEVYHGNMKLWDICLGHTCLF